MPVGYGADDDGDVTTPIAELVVTSELDVGGRSVKLEAVEDSRLPVPVGPYDELELLPVGYGALEEGTRVLEYGDGDVLYPGKLAGVVSSGMLLLVSDGVEVTRGPVPVGPAKLVVLENAYGAEDESVSDAEPPDGPEEYGSVVVDRDVITDTLSVGVGNDVLLTKVPIAELKLVRSEDDKLPVPVGKI